MHLAYLGVHGGFASWLVFERRVYCVMYDEYDSDNLCRGRVGIEPYAYHMAPRPLSHDSGCNRYGPHRIYRTGSFL